MFNKNTSIALVLLLVLNVTFFSWFIYDSMHKPKTGFIFIEEVFSGFLLKKELQGKYEKVTNSKKKILDSLEMSLKLMVAELDQEKKPEREKLIRFNVMKEDFYKKKEAFAAENQALSKQYDSQIIQQMSQYVADYGKQNGYSFIYGNDGNGALMYAEDSKNISKEVLQYINSKYSGQ
ncbi:MAG TPA: OmpH family outer membrane protein [Bacteroidia bacterium]|nr:OmpH family outer membrane protein [Bacteroidia bacterium]